MVELDEFIVMPNHVHGIIWIRDHDRISVGANDYLPLRGHGTSKTIGSIVRGFKIGVVKMYGELIWQRNYYERVIHNENELFAIRKYIIKNPLKWEMDPEKPRPKR